MFVEPKRFKPVREVIISTGYRAVNMIKAEFQDIGNKSICHIEPLPYRGDMEYTLPDIRLVIKSPDGKHTINDVSFLDISTDSTNSITVYRRYNDNKNEREILRTEEWKVEDNAKVHVDIDAIDKYNLKIEIY